MISRQTDLPGIPADTTELSLMIGIEIAPKFQHHHGRAENQCKEEEEVQYVPNLITIHKKNASVVFIPTDNDLNVFHSEDTTLS